MTAPGVLQAKGRGVAKALKAIGERTGRPVRMDTKDRRVRLQKLVYLLRAAGHPAARKFEFNMYLNGPYSSDLAEVYYALGNDGLDSADPAIDLPEATLNDICDADRNGVEFLEALTTVMNLAGAIRAEGNGKPPLGEGLAWARSMKPHIGAETWKGVREFLRTHPSLAGTT
jgi:hypothetical protein